MCPSGSANICQQIPSPCNEAHRTFSWTPTPGTEGKLFKVCAIAKDNNPECGTRHTRRPDQCPWTDTLQYKDTCVVHSIVGSSKRSTLTGFYGSEHCVNINVSSPNPKWDAGTVPNTSATFANLCDDGIFCNGISFLTTSGKCTKVVDPCDDFDDTTTDSCNEARKRCYHEAIVDASTCITDCVPTCTGKACGEDGCNGFCGSCAEGSGCQTTVSCTGEGDVAVMTVTATCVAGMVEGTCDNPFNLGSDPSGEAKYTVEFREEDLVTVVTSGTTSDSVHKMTPSCNYLTAAPERAYSFEVPAAMVANGDYVGYDIRVEGYDTMLEVMYGNCSIKNSIG